MNCGQKLDDGARFCERCGQPQQAAGTNQPAVPIPAPQPQAYPGQSYAFPAGTINSGFSVNAEMPAFQDFARKVRKRAWIFAGILATIALIAILIFAREELGLALLVFAVVAAFTALLTLISHAKTRKAWEGQLVDKKIIVKRDHDNDSSVTRYRSIPTLFFVTATGKKVKMELGSQNGAFEYYEPGCFVRKHAGFHFPEKRDKGAEIICAYCGKIYDRQLNACPKCKLIALK